jgi:exopolysaccharide/PEP-CTERM locus tyrosine autokinase
MSLIEQAAKRLEELRRAGAELPAAANPGQPVDAARSVVETPTPEALVHALEKRGSSPIVPITHERREPQLDVAPTEPPPTNGTRRAVLDFDRLRGLGIITPDGRGARVADEFGVIKRPIVRNALGKSGQRVKNGNVIIVTSALPGEGKTFTSINLAMSVAMEVDTTVVLVDGDVAHPEIPTLLDVPSSLGLLDVLTRDDVSLGDALIRTNIPNLSVLPAGQRQQRATELLASEQMASLVSELGSRYRDRIIIFDSPPLLATTEARVLASHMGQVVLVVAAETTPQQAVNEALATIESCEIVLTMLNKSSRTDVSTYYDYHRNGDERSAS